MSQNIQSSVPTDKDIMGLSQFLLMVQREDLPRAFLSRRVTVLVPTDKVQNNFNVIINQYHYDIIIIIKEHHHHHYHHNYQH